MSDPAYEHEWAELAEMCDRYLTLWKVHQQTGEAGGHLLLTIGQMLAQIATIYKLSPPGGLIDVASMFERDAGLDE